MAHREGSPQDSATATSNDYYQLATSSGGPHGFMDLDDATHFDHCLRLAQSPVTRNFVLDFSDSASWVSFDLSTSNVEALVQAERPQALRTRWINIWHPEHHGPMLEVLAKRYDFSPRLLVLMSSDPRNDGNAASNLPIIGGAKRRRNLWKRRSPAAVPNSDLEKGTNELMEDASILSYDSVAQSNLYTIVRDLWHYSSMDFGRNYICMGYNSLYGTKGEAAGAGHGPLPHCVRLWTWLVLCQDGTVISINESPFPFSEGRLDDFQHKVVMETRRNLVNVFRSLSLANTGSMLAQRPMSALPIRARLGETLEETIHRDTDAPGLLFYYLFENWHNTYTLITRRESRYGVELEELRTEMIQAPELRHIDRLDSIGKELGVIRRHFDSYDRMIDRLLEPRGATTASLQNSRVVSESSQATLDTVRPLITQTDSMLGVSLSSASQVRFRRLKDLIDLYALSEVEEYIKQKDALVTMNFNLIAITQARDVEKLTRVALLLTRITSLFIPVSLVIGYFSIPFGEIVYTADQFWAASAVTLVISWIALLFFGLYSGTAQTSAFFLSLWRGSKRAGGWLKRLSCL